MNKKKAFEKTLREAGPEDMMSAGFDPMDLIRMVDVYQYADQAYNRVMKAIDASKNERARGIFEEQSEKLSEICMPIEMLFNEMDESDSWPNQALRSRWMKAYSQR